MDMILDDKIDTSSSSSNKRKGAEQQEGAADLKTLARLRGELSKLMQVPLRGKNRAGGR